MTERYLWAHSVMHHHNELNVTKWLIAGSCITVWVKWLAGNEIERGIGIPTFESRASNVPIDKGNSIRLIESSTSWFIRWDHRGACRSQYGHPGSAIGYWPEKCLGHVYIVLKPVGSARLTFIDDIVLYELCMLVTECCSESQVRSQTWRGVSKW